MMPVINVKLDLVHKVQINHYFERFLNIVIKSMFYCCFFYVIGQPGIRSKFATISVLVPPEPPKILQGDFLVTTEDREIELECVSVGGKPAAEVILFDRPLFRFQHLMFRANFTNKMHCQQKRMMKKHVELYDKQ